MDALVLAIRENPSTRDDNAVLHQQLAAAARLMEGDVSASLAAAASLDPREHTLGVCHLL